MGEWINGIVRELRGKETQGEAEKMAIIDVIESRTGRVDKDKTRDKCMGAWSMFADTRDRQLQTAKVHACSVCCDI